MNQKFSKMKRLIFLILFGLISYLVLGQSQYPNGDNLVIDTQLNHLKVNTDYAKISFLNNPEGTTPILEFETLTQPKFIYNCATAIPIKKADYNKGRVFLVSFEAKTIKSSLETGEAKLNILFRQTASYKDNLVTTQSISSNWQKYFIPIQSTVNLTRKEFRLIFHYGFKPQSFQIKNLTFEVFPEATSVSDLPKTKITYQGMEADAPWRKEALQRIDRFRKGSFSLQFTKNGKPLAEKGIAIKLVNHLFPFGGAISAKEIVETPQNYKYFKKAFNHVVLANDLKIKAWNWKNRRPNTLKALEILKNDGYNTKGHVLIWPGFNYLTNDIRVHKDDSDYVINYIHNHVTDILDTTKGYVLQWDVVNEAYTNKDLQKITGSENILYDGFRILKEKQPRTRAFTNEYGIISKGGLDTAKQQWYYDFIKRIDANTNSAVDGIGIQCHIGSDLTPPERVLELLSFYATLGKQISISEFTMDIKDPQIREQYTRDFMIAALSHPNVCEFMFWGYVDDERAKVDIYTKDWEIGPMGKAFFGLVHDTWKTSLSGTTDNDGIAASSGFFGTYEYTFVEDGKVIKGNFDVLPRKQNSYKIDVE